MKNTLVFGMIILFLMAGCSGKSAAQSSSKATKASPVSDFSYDLSKDGNGIKITGYTGAGGAVIIPSKIEDMPVVEIGQYSFSGQASTNRAAITSIVLPESVVEIGMNAFTYTAITSVTLPDSLKIIPANAFSGCSKLNKINLPANLEGIAGEAFSGCSELSELIIPAALTSVKFLDKHYYYDGVEESENHAFAGCGKLPIKTRQKLKEFGYVGF